jgi:hypothetical protein
MLGGGVWVAAECRYAVGMEIDYHMQVREEIPMETGFVKQQNKLKL